MANTMRFLIRRRGNTAYGSTAKAIGRGVVLSLALTSSFLTLRAAGQQDTADPKSEKQTENKSSKLRPANAAAAQASPAGSTGSELALIKELLTQQQEQLAAQQRQIVELRQALEEQKQLLEASAKGSPELLHAPNLGQVASLAPVVPSGPPGGGSPAALPVPRSPSAGLVPQANEPSTQSYVEKVDKLGKTVESTVASLAGFRFGGDFRLRADGTFRSQNRFAGAYQDARGNYRLRFNVDKALNDQLSAHFQLGSGRANNPLTYNTDFSGFAARGPIFIGEAWGSYHPNSNIDLVGGRLPELFADDSRFLFKEDIRFDGFQENFKIPTGSNPLGITRIDLRGAQYMLNNPNVPSLPTAKACTPAPAQVINIKKLPATATITTPAPLPASCAYLNAGYLPGQRVRGADLFHEGFGVTGDLKPGWHQQLIADLQSYRNQNQIALAATAAGAPVVIGPLYSTGSFLPIAGTGTATTTPGGAMFTAPHFQIAHLKYRLGYDGWKLKDHELPTYVEFHAARNMGTSFLRNAAMGIVSFGDTQKAGDARLLYGYALKEGNSMISEVTDDYLGSLTGVNMRTHEIRVDVGLSRSLAWQNYVYIQKEVSGNDPKRHFFVPIPAGAATGYRVQSQLQFKF